MANFDRHWSINVKHIYICDIFIIAYPGMDVKKRRRIHHFCCVKLLHSCLLAFVQNNSAAPDGTAPMRSICIGFVSQRQGRRGAGMALDVLADDLGHIGNGHECGIIVLFNDLAHRR